jgi:predicted flap endonuclease-1-like 5' DNA nuclease
MPNGWGWGVPPRLEEVEGIGPAFAKRLRDAGVRTMKALLKKGADRKGRKEIANSVRTSPKHVLEWVNRADLFRVKGVGEQYSDLLEKSGVDTPLELSKRQPADLYETLAQVNDAKKLVRRLPTEKQVKDWVKTAKKLHPVVKY